MDVKLLKKLIDGETLEPEAEAAALEFAAKHDTGLLVRICAQKSAQHRGMQKELAKARTKQAKAEAALEKVLQPPLHPARVLRVASDRRFDVVGGGRRMLVSALPDLDASAIEPGDEVLLDTDGGVIVTRSEVQDRSGSIGTVAEVHGEQIVVRGVGEEASVMLATPSLVGSLQPGERIVYARDVPFIVDRLPEKQDSPFLLEDAPVESFDSIGGLDALIHELRSDLDLHLLHPDVAEDFQLKLLRGVTLVGAPGVGKTLLAKAIANHLAKSVAAVRFLHVKPGALRGIYYGEAEKRIRDLFDVAHVFAGLVVVFFDELDTFGTRGEGAGRDIDGRVLGALLAEIDGLESASNVLCIGATNRLDLCDAALTRGGRMGDRIYTIPRPGREATHQILSRYLVPGLAYEDGDAVDILDAATGYLHAPVGGVGALATVTLRGGEQREVRPADVLSGALLESAVERAKHTAAHRVLESGNGAPGAGGLRIEDVFAALDESMAVEAGKISAPHVARTTLEFSDADEIVRVEVAPERRLSRHRYMRAA